MIKIIIFLVGLYFLIGALLFTYTIIMLCKKNNIRFSKMTFEMRITTASGRQYEGMNALLLFIRKWPEVIPLLSKM